MFNKSEIISSPGAVSCEPFFAYSDSRLNYAYFHNGAITKKVKSYKTFGPLAEKILPL
jgi:hypothetical protein